MGSGPAPGAVFRALPRRAKARQRDGGAENIRPLGKVPGLRGLSYAKRLDTGAYPATPGAGVLPKSGFRVECFKNLVLLGFTQPRSPLHQNRLRINLVLVLVLVLDVFAFAILHLQLSILSDLSRRSLWAKTSKVAGNFTNSSLRPFKFTTGC
jgi:hypothetical protein